MKKILCLILAACMMGTLLISCKTSNNMKFESEEEMKTYLKGTFEGEAGVIIIEGEKIIVIDKDQFFGTSEGQMGKVLDHLDGIDGSKMNIYQFYSVCRENEIGITENTISKYLYDKGRLEYGSDSEKLNVDVDGNLVDKEGNKYVWLSEETDMIKDVLEDRFGEYMVAFSEYRKKMIGSTVIPESALLSAMNSFCYYAPENLKGWYSAPIGKIIASACPEYSISYSHYELNKSSLMEDDEISKFEQNNRSNDLSNAFFVTVTGRTRYSTSTNLTTETETVATVLIVLDSSNEPVYYSFIEVSDTLMTYSMHYLL
ncbi:MAG: hypothetical protein E7647_08065 [Ruminococcaceae bacterium]|nr:hypothetical protein [Oscillospiraceae bacterium]